MKHINASWLELNTHQPESAIAFYSKTLGWEFEPTELPDGGDYWIARHNDKAVGGVFSLYAMKDRLDDNQIPSHWMTYMHVKDIDKAQEVVCEAGGAITRPALHLDGIGKLVLITDGDGALIGLIQTDSDS